MAAAERTEDVLKRIHVLFSKAEPYNGSKRRVIVDKMDMMDLLKELNECMYDMMDEHELTVQSREKALRQQQKELDDLSFEARKKAEDIYAASVIYSDQALAQIQDIMKTAEDRCEQFYQEMRTAMKEQRQQVKTNQYDLKSQLQDFIDVQKYTKLIDEENARRAKEKEEGSELPPQGGAMAAPAPEIKINTEYFEKAGLEVPGEEGKASDEKGAADLSVDLDAEYFEWKENEDGQKETEDKKSKFSLFSKKDA